MFLRRIEESEKEANPGHLGCAASALPLSYDNRAWVWFPVTAGLFTVPHKHLISLYSNVRQETHMGERLNVHAKKERVNKAHLVISTNLSRNLS